MRREHLFAAFFFVAFCFLLYQFYRILSGFIGPLSYAALLAFIFYPLQARLRGLVGGRDGLAAGLMTVATLLLVVVPMLYLLAVVSTESVALYEDLSAFVTSGRLTELMDRLRGSRLGLLVLEYGPRLNLDLPAFREINPTAENIAVFIWKVLQEKLPPGLLCEIKLHETENNMVIYRGD